MTKKRASRRKRTSTWRRRGCLESLIELAREPVPLGSGIQTFGKGPHCYTKIARDGSVRIFHFRSLAGAQRAMAAGVAADDPLEDAIGGS